MAKPMTKDEPCETCGGNGYIYALSLDAPLGPLVRAICPTCDGTGRKKKVSDG